ncbi:unnamed protein product [Ophioblennius macclurei]
MTLIILAAYLSLVLRLNHGSQVVQTVDLVKVLSVSCQHTAQNGSVQDVKLNRISPGGVSEKISKGARNCIKLPPEGDKQVFLLLDGGPEAMSSEYQCEVWVRESGDIPTYDIKKATPTKLQPGRLETNQSSSPPPTPPPPPPDRLTWFLIGPLALMSLYSCFITVLLVRAKSQKNRVGAEGENATYVEMKKAPRPHR